MYWNDESCFCINSELDLFNVPPLNVSSTNTFYSEVTPVNSITEDGPIEFSLKQDVKTFTNLSDSYLYLTAKILKDTNEAPDEPGADGALPAESKVFPVNYFSGALFKNVILTINQKTISDSDNLYPYRSFIEHMLTYNDDYKKEQGALAFFYKDTGDYNEMTHIDPAHNKGAAARLELTKHGKEFEVFVRIHCDLFNQSKLLPGDVPIHLKFIRSETNFALMANEQERKYKINLQKAVLFVKKVTVTDSFLQALNETRSTEIMKYPMKKIVMKYKTHPRNMSELQCLRLIADAPIPKRIIMGLIDARGFDGHLHHNPFYFENFKVSAIEIKKGNDKLPFQEMKVDFVNGMFKEAYLALIYSTGRMFKNTSMGITPDEFKKGMALYAIDLSKNGPDLPTFEINESGTIDVTVTLKEAVNHSIVTLFYIEHDQVLSIAANNEAQFLE